MPKDLRVGDLVQVHDRKEWRRVLPSTERTPQGYVEAEGTNLDDFRGWVLVDAIIARVRVRKVSR